MNIRLPFEQKANPVLEGNPRLITYKYFFNRKVAFLKEADAVALFPGGFGTLDEAMETLTLVQTGKRNPMPLVLVDGPGRTYWTNWIKFFEDELHAHGYISDTDFSLFERVDSVDAAVRLYQPFLQPLPQHEIREWPSRVPYDIGSCAAPYSEAQGKVQGHPGARGATLFFPARCLRKRMSRKYPICRGSLWISTARISDGSGS